MESNMKNIIVSIIFLSFITTIFFINIFSTPNELSYSERRQLAQFPEFSVSALLNRDWIEKFDKYTLDQFAFRDEFRTWKAITLFNVFAQKDNNNIYIVDDSVYKIEYPLKKNSIEKAAKKLNEIYDKYLRGMKVYYSIIPDKNYFTAKQNGYPCLNYELLVDIMNKSIENMGYIDIFDCLSLEDYYRTDPHWRQENLGGVVAKISKEMGYTKDLSAIKYTAVEKYPFYGVYYRQSALPLEPDSIIYLTNETIENAVVYNYETKRYMSVYGLEKFGKTDSYDIFMSGAIALMTIYNPKAKTDKELIIFRDSYGSSLAPLLIEEYNKITLVDLRYITTASLEKYIDFGSQDVLFIYSALVLNNSDMLR